MRTGMARAAGAVLFLACVGTVASAHVSLATKGAALGGGYKAVFSVPHGCEGAPTVEVRIDTPEGVIGVKPTPGLGWTSIAGELAPGSRLAVPVTQKCETGEAHWSQLPAEGEDAHALDVPAQLTLVGDAAPSGHAAHHAAAAGGITIEAPWSRPVGAGTPVAVGYLKIANGGKEPDVLLGGSSDVAARVELHETTIGEDGVSRMRKLEGLEIKPGETVELKPLGAHLMLIEPKRPLAEGTTFKATLNFKNAGPVDVEFTVKAAGGAAPAHHH